MPKWFGWRRFNRLGPWWHGGYGWSGGRRFGIGSGGFGWDRFGWGGPMWVHGQFTIPTQDDLDKVRDIIRNSSLGPSYINRWGMTRIPIIHDDMIIGWLFENVDLNSVDVQGLWKVDNLVKVHLIFSGRIVGWVAVHV